MARFPTALPMDWRSHPGREHSALIRSGSAKSIGLISDDAFRADLSADASPLTTMKNGAPTLRREARSSK
eukprot:1190211-Rhodomonas_salina.2